MHLNGLRGRPPKGTGSLPLTTHSRAATPDLETTVDVTVMLVPAARCHPANVTTAWSWPEIVGTTSPVRVAPGPRSASCSRGSRGDLMGMTTDHCLTGVPAGRHPSMGVGTSGPVGVAPGPRLAFCTREPRGVHPQSSCLRLGLPLPLVTTGHPLGCRRQPGEKVYPPLLSPTVVNRSHHMDLPLMIQRLGRGYSTSAC